jgi:putative salt-induced outer membrane protein YdiY
MTCLTGGERRRLLSLVVLVVTAVSLVGGSAALAQVEEPVPADDPHPAAEEERGTPRSELGKDAGPMTTVLVEKAQEDLPQAYTIQFGDEFDWVRLASGEWLRGNLERMRDGSLSFDSSELKLLTYDWKKVQELHSPRANTYVFTEGDDLVGPAMINEEFVTVQTVDGIVIRPRSELLGIIEHTERERNYWSTVLRLGLTANAGNTENLTFNAFWSLVREDALTRTQITYDGTFGTAARAEVANRHLGGGDVDIYVHPIVFIKALTGQLLYDKFQNIRLRATPAAGLGVHIITTYVVNWDFETAPGYQYLSLLDPAASVENPQSDGYWMFRMFADIDFTDDIQLLLDWRTNLVFTTISNTNHVGSMDFSLRITSILHFNTSFLYLRTEQPFPRSDGTVPKKNDYQIVVGISLRLG